MQEWVHQEVCILYLLARQQLKYFIAEHANIVHQKFESHPPRIIVGHHGVIFEKKILFDNSKKVRNVHLYTHNAKSVLVKLTYRWLPMIYCLNNSCCSS